MHDIKLTNKRPTNVKSKVAIYQFEKSVTQKCKATSNELPYWCCIRWISFPVQTPAQIPEVVPIN